MLKAALAALSDPSTPPGMIAVAVAAVAEAVHQGLPIPGSTPKVLWHALRRSPEAKWGSLASETIGALGTPKVIAEILDTLRASNVGVDLADAALDALSGPAAARHVTDRDLLDIAERARGRLVHRAALLIQAVCEHRLVPGPVVAQIAEAWSSREKPARLAALDLLELLDRNVAQKLVQHALDDDHRAVRSTAAMKISEVFDSDTGLAVVRRRITIEADNTVLADLRRGEAELIVLLPKS